MDHPVEEDLSKVQCHFVDYSIKEEKEKERENGTEQEAVKSEKLKFPLNRKLPPNCNATAIRGCYCCCCCCLIM